MIEKLIYFINRPNTNTRDPLFRKKTGYFVSITGIIFNILLSVAKVMIGLFVHSIAIMADAVNNIFDTISSVVTLLGFKLSEKPADREHPYGHGRIEYISGLLISIIVIIIGLQFIKSSVLRILPPDVVKFDKLSFIIMILSILVKVFITILNKKAGNMIDSKAMKATSIDSLGDVFTTMVVIVPMISSLFTEVQIDGYFGVLVSLMIIKNGIEMIKETIGPILGEEPDKDLIEKIYKDLEAEPLIKNVHDFHAHNYGPDNVYISLDVEMPAHLTIEEAHNVIDSWERTLEEKYNINIIIHVDPYMEEDECTELYKKLGESVRDDKNVVALHDFRVLNGNCGKDIVLLDIVLNDMHGKDKEALANAMRERFERDVSSEYDYRLRIIPNFTNIGDE